jgi:hypothetical protein
MHSDTRQGIVVFTQVEGRHNIGMEKPTRGSSLALNCSFQPRAISRRSILIATGLAKTGP